MTDSNQQQKAGAHSRQYQIAGDLVIQEGVTEERAHEISRQTFHELYAQYSEESHEIATSRVEQLDAKYIKQLAEAELLGVLADPAYQVTLRKAQLGAASTERESDYDLLAGLLADRAKRANNRPIRAGINRAVEVVDQLDDAALAGITVMSVATQLRPVAHFVEPGIDAMENLLRQVMEGVKLPAGDDWLEHLDVLDVVRIDMVQTLKKFDEYWPGKTPGYVSVGVEADSEEDRQAREQLGALGLPPLITPHELKPGFNRLAYPDLGIMADVLREKTAATPEQIAEAEHIGRDVYGADKVDEELAAAYMERAKSRPFHRQLSEWWDAIPHAFNMTAVGKVLARSNAKRLDVLGILPPLD